MKLEIGKYYTTRDGRKARIYAVDGDKNWRVHGAILEGGEWCHAAWRGNGKAMWNGHEVDTDLVSEWTDPGPRRLAWTDSNGHLMLTEFLPVDLPGYSRMAHLDEPEAT